MKALWIEERQLRFRQDVPVPVPGEGEALLKVRLAGICGTDLELLKGYASFTGVPGHEFVAEVVRMGGARQMDEAWVGQRVVADINITCGVCDACQAGRSSHCSKRTVLGIRERYGAFAEFISVPVGNLHPVVDGISDEWAVFTEPLAAALQIQQQVDIRPSDRVVLIGAGRLGQLIAQTLALTGCNLSVVARHVQQKALLQAHKITVIPEHELIPGKADVVVDASGTPEGFHLAYRAVRPRGTVILKSTFPGEQAFNFSDLVVNEITIVGSRCGPFEPALYLLNKQYIDPTPLIQGIYALEDGLEAFRRAGNSGVLKILIDLRGDASLQPAR